MHKVWPMVTVSLFLLLIYHLNIGEGLKCYVCRSDTDANCTSDHLSPKYSLECPTQNGRAAILCRKIHQELRFKKEDKFTSVRECGYEEGHLRCYFFKYIELAFQETCECMKDNCNLGSSPEPGVLMIVLMFVFLIVHFTNANLMDIA